MNTITIEKLHFSYKDKEVLKDVSFKVKRPALVSIVGVNNSGKTTLIKCLSGIMMIDESINLNDIILNKKNIKKYARNIGVIFSRNQNQFLFNKVLDEITFPLCNLNYSKKQIKQAINEMDKLLFLDDILDKNINSLNELEKIKVLLATALIHQPKALFLDDALLGLNKIERERIILTLKRIVKEKNIIVIMTTSSLEDTIYSDAILVLDHGEIRFGGTLDEILKHDNTLTKLGIEIPTMMDMSLKLEFYNLLNRVILEEEEMVDVLWD